MAISKGKLKIDYDNAIAEVVGRRFCINPEQVLKWMRKKGYTHGDFGKIINESKNFEKFLQEIINA